MIDNALPFIEENAGYWPRMNATKVVHCLKSAAILSTLAVSLLGSAYLAYTNPRKWILTTASVLLVNLYALPKILHYGNATMIKFGLIANLIALSTLSLGGLGVANFNAMQLLWTSVKTCNFKGMLFTSFLVTGMLGYGVPLFRGALEKAYHFLQDPHLQERFESLREQFHARAEVGLGLMQGGLQENFLLHIALFQPRLLLDFCQLFEIALPNYAWPLVAAASDKIEVDQFNHLLTELENVSNLVNFQRHPLSDTMQATYYLSLKLALRSLKQSDLPVALSSLLPRGAKLIPNIISNKQFLELFTEDALTATNEALENFLELMDGWEELSKEQDALSVDIQQLEQDIQNQNLQKMTSEEEEIFFQRQKDVQQQFTELRTQIEKIYFQKRLWQDFAPLWDKETDIPFERTAEFLDILHNQNLLKEIEDIYYTMIANGQGGNRTLIDRMQYIKNKLVTLHGDEEEEEVVSSIMYLAANRNFVQKDFEDLQEWLHLDSPHDLEDALAEMGLATEKDLYENDILPHQGVIPKSTILTNLRQFIEKAPQPKLTDRVKPQAIMNPAAPAYKVAEKVTRFIFYAMTSGLILVPILIKPIAGGIGFVLGTCFFILRRFGVPGTEAFADFSYNFINDLPFGSFIHSLLARRIFSINRDRRDQANQFVNSDFFARMRIINFQVGLSLFMSYFSIRFEEPICGSFFQGVAIADEALSLF